MAVQVRASNDTGRGAIESEILAEYRDRSPRSAALHEEARRVMPGGDTRTIAFHAPYPLAIDQGEGYQVVDADGRIYIDCLNNYTALIHGHGFPAITAAAVEQTRRGTAFPAPNQAQTRLAWMISERVQSVDLIRFCNSGSEAVMNAIRAARAFTGREVIVKMEGGYHGTYDDVEVSVRPDPRSASAGSAGAPTAVLDAPGVPNNTVSNVVVTPFNDVAAAERVLTERGPEIAAVIVEPVMGAGGMIPARPDFIEALRVLTVEQGALLIFDEVMSFRLEQGGMQQHYRVRPDLTTFAKIIGGGFPVGAFGGRTAVMEQFDPSRPAAMSQSGTFNGNAVTMAAGVAAMEAYPEGEVSRINGLGSRLRDRFREALARESVLGSVTGYGSFAAIHLGCEEVHDYRGAAAADRSLARLLHVALLLEGVFCAPRLMGCISTPMDETVVDEIGRAFERAIHRLAPVA